MRERWRESERERERDRQREGREAERERDRQRGRQMERERERCTHKQLCARCDINVRPIKNLAFKLIGGDVLFFFRTCTIDEAHPVGAGGIDGVHKMEGQVISLYLGNTRLITAHEKKKE